VATPKLDALVEVAKQAVWNLKRRETGIKIKEPPAKPEKVKEPTPKRHQHPLPTKGKSAYVGKGKATTPGKKQPEVITMSAKDVLESLLPVQEPKVTSSPRPTATIVPKLISTTAEMTNTKAMQIEEKQNKDEARELPPVTNVEPDLELSQDSDEEDVHGICVVDLDAEKPSIEFSDVEPDYTAAELAAQKQQPTTPTSAMKTLLPGILIDFQETVVISDDASETAPTTTPARRSATLTSSADIAASIAPTDIVTSNIDGHRLNYKSILVTEPYRPTSPPVIASMISSAMVRTPTVKSTVVVVSTATTLAATVTTDAPTTATATTSGPSSSGITTTPPKPSISGRRPSSSAVSDDIPTRKLCQPAKPYNAVWKVKTLVPEPVPVQDRRKRLNKPDVI